MKSEYCEDVKQRCILDAVREMGCVQDYKKIKASHTRYQTLCLKLSRCTVVPTSHPTGGRLPLLSAGPVITFPAAKHHRFLAGTMLYCLVTEEHRCEQLAQGCYAALAPSCILINDLLIASPTLYPLRHCATSGLCKL